jgi:hypothetical protein
MPWLPSSFFCLATLAAERLHFVSTGFDRYQALPGLKSCRCSKWLALNMPAAADTEEGLSRVWRESAQPPIKTRVCGDLLKVLGQVWQHPLADVKVSNERSLFGQ